MSFFGHTSSTHGVFSGGGPGFDHTSMISHTQPQHVSTHDGYACTFKGAVQACGKNMGPAIAGGAAAGAIGGLPEGGIGAGPGAVVGGTAAGVGNCAANVTSHLGGCW